MTIDARVIHRGYTESTVTCQVPNNRAGGRWHPGRRANRMGMALGAGTPAGAAFSSRQ